MCCEFSIKIAKETCMDSTSLLLVLDSVAHFKFFYDS